MTAIISGSLQAIASDSAIGSAHSTPSSEGTLFAFPTEIRMGLGAMPVNPTGFNDGFDDRFHTKMLVPFGADILALPNSWPLACGLRYENIAALQGYILGERVELNIHRFALLGSYRFQKQNFFVAPSASVGIFHVAQVDTKIGSTAKKSYRAKSSQSASGGLEFGWSDGTFTLGSEVGFEVVRSQSFETDQNERLTNSTGEQKSADFQGVYGKVLLGVRI